MNALAWITYWAARISSFLHEAWWRGWHQIRRTDYRGPPKWGER